MLRVDTKSLSEKLRRFWEQNRNTASVVIAALVLTVLIFAARAGGPFAGFEGEGALGSGVIVKNDANASGGQYVEFADSTSNPTAFDKVLANGEKYVSGFTVPAGQTWGFDPTKNTTVEASGNIIVHGRLVLKPNSGVTHTLRFTNIDESKFVGGGMDPVKDDVGLWVMGAGVLEAQGKEKKAWDYVWHNDWSGDEVVATPHTKGDFFNFKTVNSAADVPAKNTYGYAPELLNLTRNVNIEGTPSGKTHIFIRSTQPQTIRYTTIRYVAPSSFSTEDTTGRYGIHLHHSLDGSRDSMVEGVVIRDADNHAFVAHRSHGVTFKDTIAYNTTNAAYWWDPSDNTTDNSTNDTLFDRTVAAKTGLMMSGVGSKTGAYILGHGENNSVINSVAVGVVKISGNNLLDTYSGFDWPPRQANFSLWGFDNNISHNNGGHGILVYQNNSRPHLITNYTAYHNNGFGVHHGAYINAYHYTSLTLMGNGEGGIASKALGTSGTEWQTQEWDNVKSDGAFTIVPHVVDAGEPIFVKNCEFSELNGTEGGRAGWYEFINCNIPKIDLSGLNPDTTIILNGQVLQKGIHQ